MTPEIERLITEFKAQDVGAHLVVYDGNVHTKVAEWNEGNQMWVLLKAGADILAGNTDDSEAPAKRGRKPKSVTDIENPFANIQ